MNEKAKGRAGVKKLEVSGLSFSFGAARVFKDLSFSVEDGEFLSILGSSGCGKTTLLRILIGLVAPDGGRLLKDGADITRLPPSRRGMGIVFQNYALFEHMTVLGNVEYALRHGQHSRQRRARAREVARELIGQMGLEEHANKRPYRLSGGQQQRVAIARTLALRPDVILLDEPMSALDADTRLGLRGELKRIQASLGTTMVYVTHDQEEAFALSDRIMVMDGGVIQQMDTPEGIVDHPANAYVERFVLHNLRIKIDSLTRYGREV
jgi:ABC-type Fe3+/spermidine/putrescine transport system ATPase subunit